ncbi:hypothetical protein QYF61_011681 [Mycteria americana]|uniref:Integrase catalytic domain-containing protein n=1 Tax=Mycteria americana TaxID=33587 RepID=A0AAN7PSH5_MYCAM|nr:hypothetical protein QYF61_011681 [Mycteria americana]
MKGFELLQKWLALKHSSSWHPDCRCWAGCSKGGSPLHIMQLVLRGVRNHSHPGILGVIMDWPEGQDFGISPEEEVMHAEEAPLHNKLSENEKQYALKLLREKAIQLALDIAGPVLYPCTDSRMVANALCEWLQQWKQSNWQCTGKPIGAAALWQDMAAWVESLVVKACHVDAHVPKSWAAEEHQNNQQVDQAAEIEGAQVDLDWQHKGELFIAWWAHDTSGHQGRDATYRWRLSMNVKHAAIKQAKRLKPLWYGGRWLKYKYGEAWQIDYITLPQTRPGKCHVLTMVEATTGWLETYPVPHATAQNTLLGLEKQVLWRRGTPERIESDNGTHF